MHRPDLPEFALRRRDANLEYGEIGLATVYR
jgi:hypothetical protein